MIKGQNLRVFVGDSLKAVAEAQSCTLHIGTQTESAQTKDDADDWDVIDIVGKSWDVRTQALVLLTDNGSNGELTVDLIDLILNSTKVKITFDKAGGTNNRTGQNSTIKLQGYCYMNDLNLDAAVRQNSQGQYQFIGTGPLSKVS